MFNETHHSLLSRKGNAAPSPAMQIAAPPQVDPPTALGNTNTNQLMGLIKRKNSVRHNHVENSPEDISFPVNASPIKNSIKNLLTKRDKPRRQLTVRVDFDLFEKLESLSKKTGKSYQEIQSHALKNLIL